MEIDCVLVVVPQPLPSPSPKEIQCCLPTTMALWADPHWTGIWVQAEPGGEAAVFRVRFTLAPIAPESSMMLAAGTGGKLTINGGCKVHFFAPSEGRETNVPDFCYASAFPLTVFTDPPTGAPRVWGLWNSNQPVCDPVDGHSLQGVQLQIVNRRQASVPREASVLLSQAAPSPQTHRETIMISRWFKSLLNKLYPQRLTHFKNPRTFSRDPWSDIFFFDQHRLFGGSPGTNLPPILALYALGNALIVNGESVESMEALLLRADRLTIKAEVDLLLCVVRDVLVCFSFCPREGRYRDDLLMGRLVEDQPHSFAFTQPGTRTVFGEDDCEGRTQQGCVHMKELLCCIARDFRAHEGLNVKKHLEQYKEGGCLRGLSEASLDALVLIARGLGELFLNGVLDALMCVGDCRSASEMKARPDTGGVDGHSFGLLLYTTAQMQGATMIEATINQSKSKRDAGLRVPEMAVALRALVHAVCKERAVSMARTLITQEEEDEIFDRVYFGNDTIFFTHTAEGRVEFGVRPSLLDQKRVVYKGESKAEASQRRWGLCALLVSPPAFLSAVQDGRGLWPMVEQAGTILQRYQALSSQYASFHRVLKPPQDREEELVRRMNSYWAPLQEGDLRQPCQDIGHTLSFAFAGDLRGSAVGAWMERFAKGKPVSKRAFMRSEMHVVRFI